MGDRNRLCKKGMEAAFEGVSGGRKKRETDGKEFPSVVYLGKQGVQDILRLLVCPFIRVTVSGDGVKRTGSGAEQ